MLNKLLLKIGLITKFPGLVKCMSVKRNGPDFLVLGFQKSGTTTLWHALLKSPSFQRGIFKENDLLSSNRFDLLTYLFMFPRRKKNKITGDLGHLNSHTPYALPRIKEHFKGVKLVVIMRNPVERAFSHFNMDKKHGYISETLSFESYIGMEMLMRKDLPENAGFETRYKHMRLFKSKYGWAITKGIYIDFINELDRYELDFHFIILEDLQVNYQSEIKKFFEYIGLEDDVPEPLQSNRGNYKSMMKEETKRFLKSFYEPYNQQLEKRLGCTLPW